MQHAIDHRPATNNIESTPQPPSAMSQTENSQSSSSSPKPKQASLAPTASQSSESALPIAPAHELTPPSSVASGQEQRDAEKQSVEEARVGDFTLTSKLSGKKRTANGQVKQHDIASKGVASTSCVSEAARNDIVPLPSSSTKLGELSQQLRTKLTYAMLKVQNGWQKHSLDEIESIASQSPCSNVSNCTAREHHSFASPRAMLAAGNRQNSDSSHSSTHSLQPRLISSLATAADAPDPRSALSNFGKGLAPPAPIISGNRRRPTPNMHLQINSALRSSLKPTRPATTQRTPSQNAAMEADAVETLLFMSASPSGSAHFPSHLSAYSPTSQAFSTQTSPLRAHFSLHNQEFSDSPIRNSPRSSRRAFRHEDKAALIDRLLNDLDDDESEELDRAVHIIEQHRAAKLST